MAVEKYRITHASGDVDVVVRRPIHMVRAEAVAGGTMTFVWASLWAAATGGKGDRKAFESWLDGVDDFEPIPDEGADADPPAHGGTGSPD